MKSIFKEYLVQPNINIFEKFQTIIKELEKIKSEIIHLKAAEPMNKSKSWFLFFNLILFYF